MKFLWSASLFNFQFSIFNIIPRFHLALGVKLGFHEVVAVLEGLYEVVSHVFGFLMEHLLQHFLGDVGAGEEFFLKLQSVAFYLLWTQAEGGLKLSQQTVDGMDGYLPDAEEAEYVVDAIGIEIFLHVLKPAYPPLATVLQYLVPVVGGEAPVLAVDGEIIGRCSCLTVEVEILWFLPHVAPMSLHADGYVALEDDVLGACILVGFLHLLCQDVLHVVVEGDLPVFLGAGVGKDAPVLLVPCVVVLPLGEVGSLVGVSQVAVLCVGHEPALLLPEPLLVLPRGKGGRALLLKEQVQILLLRLYHAPVVYALELVELPAQGFKLRGFLLVFQRRQLPKVGILRMEGKDGDAGVGIGVAPRVACRGVVDGQHLQYALVGVFHPIDHALEVAEIAHAKTALRPEGENGYERASLLYIIYLEESLREFVLLYLASAQLGHAYVAVVLGLPQRLIEDVAILDGNKLEVEILVGCVFCVYVAGPLVGCLLYAGYAPVHVPLAQNGVPSTQDEPLASPQLRSPHLESQY